MTYIPDWGMSDEEIAIIQADNLEAFKREEKFAFDLMDKIPAFKVEQDIRSKNRFREHSGDGHMLLDSGSTSHQQPNHTLHNCKCGWVGWLIPKDDGDVPKV